MKISIASSKTADNEPLIHEKSSAEITTFIEIPTHFVPHRVIEYQICCLISPILHTNLGQKVSNFLIYKLTTINTTQLSLSEVVSSSLEPSYQARFAFVMKLLSMSPSALTGLYKPLLMLALPITNNLMGG